MGIPAGGRSINDVREQAERISRCQLTFHIATGSSKGGLVNQNIVDTAMFVESKDSAQGSLMLERQAAMLLLLMALIAASSRGTGCRRNCSKNPSDLDICCWLLYRLHARPSANLGKRKLIPTFRLGFDLARLRVVVGEAVYDGWNRELLRGVIRRS